jgi:hypothetical protein
MILFKKKFNATMHDIGLGFKKAYSISLLPARVEVFYSSLVMRIFIENSVTITDSVFGTTFYASTGLQSL